MSDGEGSGSYVYLYRTIGAAGKPKYVGYGTTPARALTHSSGSHNTALEDWIGQGDYALEIAGPFANESTGHEVEAALISALKPEFNVASGDGHAFVPLGVPPELAERISIAPVDEAALARQAGGALIVYLAAGKVMRDGRAMADPSNPDETVIAADAEAWWQINRHMAGWRERPEETPRTLVAVHGPRPRSRFVIGAFTIDVDRLLLGAEDLRDGSLWKIPLINRTDADAAGLRGRKLTESTFGQGRHRVYHWVGADGVTHWDGRTHPTS
ncbi:hypothetical protein ACR8AL_11750 [Clavibacter sepedonicus]|nr:MULTISPECIES: hypothetical protein [Clavibacter]MBD5383014.1 hypothetical protein [Clavibacter sp.]UUK65259.1 hypothetical protein LRE50_13405 [Clavibacter sepedonicus]